MADIPLNRGFVAIVDEEDYLWLREFKWHVRKIRNNFYARTSLRTSPTEQVHILMHSAIMQTPKGFNVDHVNRETLDNRRNNLRICSTQQNSFNRSHQANNTSGYKGVYLNRETNKWIAQIKLNGKMRYIGRFITKEEAAIAYNEEAVKTFGEFAFLNKVVPNGF